MWPANPKIFTPRPFAQKVFRPWPKISPALETFATTFPRIAAHWGSTSHTWWSYIQSILTICRFCTCEFSHLLKFICSPTVSAFHGPSPTFPERQQNKTKQESPVAHSQLRSTKEILASGVTVCHFQDKVYTHVYLPLPPLPARWASKSLTSGRPATWKRPESSDQCMKKHHPLARNVLLGLSCE